MNDQSASRQMEMILSRVDSLPTLSPIAARVLNLGSSDEVDLQEVGRLIESDPALAARILGMCRKASTGLGDKITSVKRAVVMLGLDAVRSAVLSVSVYDLMSERGDALDKELSKADPAGGELRAACFDRVGFWKHALAVACCAELLARHEKQLGVNSDEAFIGGLLHGLGRLVLDLVLPQSYARVLALAEKRHLDCAPLEAQILGLDYTIAGKRCAEHWGLPLQLQDVIWLHTTPYSAIPEAPHRPLVGLVSVAKSYCRELYLGWSGDFGIPPNSASMAAELGIPPSTLELITQDLHNNVVERCKSLGLDGATTPQLMLQSLMQANRQLSKMTSAMQEKASHTEYMARILHAIQTFNTAEGCTRGVTGTLTAACHSAQQLTGAGTAIAVVQTADAEAWQVLRISPEGRVTDTKIFSPAAHATSLRERLANVRPGAAPQVLSGTFLESVKAFGTTDGMCVVPLRTGMKAAGAILLDRDAGLVASLPEALVSTWEAALRVATQQEDSRRMAEQFNHMNRTLVQTQAKLAETEAMAKLGAVTAGAAHEMNNPLTVISGRSQLLLTSLSTARDKAAAESIVEASRDLSDLITSLNLIATTPKAEPAVCSLMTIMDSAMTQVKERLGKAPLVSLKVGPGTEKVYTDLLLLSRSIGEAILNAAQAAPTTPIEVTCETVGTSLSIAVQDSGPGFTAQALRHAFDPFFSQKPAGRSRGLGLARARSMITGLGGEITLANTDGKGGLVVIHLPNWREPKAGAQDRRSITAGNSRVG